MRRLFLIGVIVAISNVQGGEELKRWSNNIVEVCTTFHSTLLYLYLYLYLCLYLYLYLCMYLYLRRVEKVVEQHG